MPIPHYHIWKPVEGKDGQSMAMFRVVKPFPTRSAANKAKVALWAAPNSVLPALVLVCQDPRCRHRVAGGSAAE